MKIVQINSVSNGSTGKIMMGIHKELQKRKNISYIIWGRGRKNTNNNEIYINDKIGVYFHVVFSRITGKTGFASTIATKRLIKRLKTIKPDLIHLHNLHGYYLNIEVLFNYLKKNNIKVIWTLHDCWPFTGQCPHFTLKECNKWKKQCYNCPMIHEYPKTIKDNSKWNYIKKKELFNDVNLTIVTPSKWLASLVKQSFLKKYPIYVINNGIDLSVFKPTKSNFRNTHNILNKHMILGVASVWDKRKGLNDFIRLSKILNDEYVIVLVGLSKSQINKLPNNIVGITRTENQQELAGIYTTADILFNPTYEDNYPTVNLESIACGTPVLSYDTGGSVEFTDFILKNKNNYIIEKGNINNDFGIIKKYIDNIINTKMYLDSLQLLDNDNMVKKYLELYNKK